MALYPLKKTAYQYKNGFLSEKWPNKVEKIVDNLSPV